MERFVRVLFVVVFGLSEGNIIEIDKLVWFLFVVCHIS